MRKSRILSLLLAVAVMATMLVAVPLTASAAEASTMYAEWTLNGAYKAEKEGQPGVFAGTDTKENSDVGTGHILINGPSNKSSGVTADPALYYSRDTASKNANATSTYKGSNTTYTTYSGETVNVTNTTTGLKCSGNSSYSYNYIIDPKLQDNAVDGISPESYNVRIVFWSNAKPADNKPVNVKLVDNQSLSFSDLTKNIQNGGTESESSADYNNLKVAEFTGLKNYAAFAFSEQPGFAYIGIEYVMPSKNPSIELSPTEIDVMEGETPTLTATIKNIEEPQVTWETSGNDGNLISIDEQTIVDQTATAKIKVNPGASPGKVTITAKCTGKGDVEATSNSCVVNIVPLSGTVTFSGDKNGLHGIKKITLTQTEDKNGAPVEQDPKEYTVKFQRDGSKAVADMTKEIQKVEYGKYKVEVEAAAPYYEIDEAIPDVTVDKASVEATIPIKRVFNQKPMSENKIADMAGKTVTWTFNGKSGDSKEYLNLENSDTTSVYSDDGKVFMNVDTSTGRYSKTNGGELTEHGKFNAATRPKDVQCNVITYLDIPVIKGSKITINGLQAESTSSYTDTQGTTAKLTAQDDATGNATPLVVDNSNATYTYNAKEKGFVRIVSAGSYLNTITVDSTSYKIFGTETETDSGYYTKNDQPAQDNTDKIGIIRFFQPFAGDAKVQEYGFYFINSEDAGTDEGFRTSATGDINYETYAGMYGDFIDIAESQFTTEFWAKPFVKISDEIIYGPAFKGSVGNNPKWVDKPAAQ